MGKSMKVICVHILYTWEVSIATFNDRRIYIYVYILYIYLLSLYGGFLQLGTQKQPKTHTHDFASVFPKID